MKHRIENLTETTRTMSHKIITVKQRENEHSSSMFARSRVAVGEVVEFVKIAGGTNEYWLRVDARSNNGTAWRTRHPVVNSQESWRVEAGNLIIDSGDKR